MMYRLEGSIDFYGNGVAGGVVAAWVFRCFFQRDVLQRHSVNGSGVCVDWLKGRRRIERMGDEMSLIKISCLINSWPL